MAGPAHWYWAWIIAYCPGRILRQWRRFLGPEVEAAPDGPSDQGCLGGFPASGCTAPTPRQVSYTRGTRSVGAVPADAYCLLPTPYRKTFFYADASIFNIGVQSHKFRRRRPWVCGRAAVPFSDHVPNTVCEGRHLDLPPCVLCFEHLEQSRYVILRRCRHKVPNQLGERVQVQRVIGRVFVRHGNRLVWIERIVDEVTEHLYQPQEQG